MPRHLLTLAAAASLLLCVATLALWVRSARGMDRALLYDFRQQPDGGFAGKFAELRSSGGRVWLEIGRGSVGPSASSITGNEFQNRARISGGRPRLAFHYDRHDPIVLSFGVDQTEVGRASGWGPLRWESYARTNPAHAYVKRVLRIGVSHWLLAALLATGTTWAARRRFAAYGRRTNTREHVCGTCGYDLRATPARCPECGAVPAATAAR